MKLFRIFSLAALFALVFQGLSLSARPLLLNSDWRKMEGEGVPAHWRVRGGAGAVVCRDGVAVLRRTTGAVPFLCQSYLPLMPFLNQSSGAAQRYRCSVEVMGTPGSRYRFYLEEYQGKKSRAHGSARPVPAPAAWQTVSFSFTPVFSQKSNVLALSNAGTSGEVRFRNLKLEMIAEVQNIPLPNQDWRKLDDGGSPLRWRTRGGAGAVVCRDGVAVLRKTGKAAPFLFQSSLPLKKGLRYRCSVEVMGTPGSRYRFYIEEDGGRKGSFAYGSPRPVPAPAGWKRVAFNFSLVLSPDRSLVALNNPDASGEVRFRNLKLERVNESLVLGCPVKLNGKSLLDVSDSRHPAVVASYVNRTDAGAVIAGVPVKPGRYYELCFQVKGVGAAHNDTRIFHFYDVRVDLRDGSELLRSVWEDVRDLVFVPKTFVFRVPENHAGGRIDIGLGVNLGSTVAFRIDSLKEKVIQPSDYARLVLTSPVYHHGIFATRPVSRVEGFAEMKEEKGRAEFQVLRDGALLAESAGEFADGKVKFSFDARLFKLGATRISCRILNKDGKLLKTFSETVTRYPRSSGREVVIGLDRQFYVDGRPYFPIVQWGMRPDHLPYEKQMDIETIGHVAGNGSNVFLVSVAHEKEALFLLDVALQYDAMVMISTKHVRGQDTEENCRKWKQAMQTLLTDRILKHRAFFGFFLADEPRWNGVPAVNLQKSAAMLREIDPYHPIYMVAAPRGSVEDHLPYADAVDFYGIDIYPVPEGGSHSNLEDRGLTCVGKYASRVAAMVEHRKPVLMVLQAFAWGELSSRPRKLIYPTPAQTRFMAYNSLLNGGTHVGYWAYHNVRKPELIDTISGMTRELHRMSGLMVTGRIVLEREEGGLQYRVMECGGRRYAIAANNTAGKIRAVVPAGFRTSSVLVFGENRKAAVSAGAVTEEFPAYGVRVYGEAQLPLPLYQLKDTKIPNPWIKYEEHRKLLDKLKYAGKASWIWDAKGTEMALSKVYLARIIDIRKTVRELVMYVSADNMATLWFNGRKIGETDQWEAMKKMTVEGSQIRKGENVISVYARDGFAPPCAFLADITVHYADGTSENIVTDQDWLCTMNKYENWTDAEVVRRNFKKVDFLVPYGQGPWGSRVVMKRIAEVLGK